MTSEVPADAAPQNGVRLSVSPEIRSDGCLKIKFMSNPFVELSFANIKGWRFENGWLRIFNESGNISYPASSIGYVECVYNSLEVQNQIAVRQLGKGVTDTFSCLKCGGEIK